MNEDAMTSNAAFHSSTHRRISLPLHSSPSLPVISTSRATDWKPGQDAAAEG